MTSSFQDTVLDFDLNFLQLPSSNAEIESKLEKQKKAILIAKKKTIATDLLIRKYYNKKEQLDQTEVKLLASKEECKQICIDYKDSVEKCTQLEKDVQLLQSQYAKMEQNYIISQNQVEAMKSHARQLQDLVKENETVIESMKVDNSLEKNNIKDFEKKLSSLQKKHEDVLKHLYLACNIALGKKKLHKHHKIILQKYVSTKNENDPECCFSEESNQETDIDDDSPTSPLYTVIEICPEVDGKEEGINTDDKVGVKQDDRRMIEDHESDYSNGVVSEDTGRGSSLAFSDSEKCVNSPDYFATNSPLTETNIPKDRKILIDASTSPRRNPVVVNRATSPLTFNDKDLLRDNQIESTSVVDKEYLITDSPVSDKIVTMQEKPQMIDIATSPVRDLETATVGTSPVIFMDTIETSHCNSEVPQCRKTINEDANDKLDDNVTNSIDGDRNEVRSHIVFEDLSTNCELEISGKSREERRCLENHNSRNLLNENDYEVEMILNSMQLRHKLITPLPQTPVKLSKKARRHLEPVLEKSNVERHSCPDALELREENKVLQTSIADLTKEILNIKFILRKQLIMPESPKKSSTQVNIESLNTKLSNDASQESIMRLCDTNENSITIRNEEVVRNNDEEVTVCDQLEVANDQTPTAMDETIDNNEQPHPGEVRNSNEVVFLPVASPHMSSERLSTPESIQTDSQNENNIHESEDMNVSQRTCGEKLSSLGDDLEKEGNPVVNCKIDTIEDVCENIKQRKGRAKKLSRLDKFRRRLIPKSKIKFKAQPTGKRRKCKIIPFTKPDLGSNNKKAYEKAIEVMKELNLKQKISHEDNGISVIKKRNEISENVSEKLDSENTEVQRDNNKEIIYKDKIVPKQFVICLSRLNLEKHGHDIKKFEIRETDRSKRIGPENTNPEKKIQETNDIEIDTSPSIRTTRSRSKISEQRDDDMTNLKSPRKVTEEDADEIIKIHDRSEKVRRRLKRVASDSSDVSCKRVLRSSNLRDSRNSIDDENVNLAELASPRWTNKSSNIRATMETTFEEDCTDKSHSNSEKSIVELHNNNDINDVSCNSQVSDPRQSILCKMIEKYGRSSVKFAPKKISENIVNQIYKKLETDITNITKLPVEESKSEVNKLVGYIQELNTKHFMAGLMKYLKDPLRKQELFNKVTSAPAPPMTKSEQVLLYILKELEVTTPDFVNLILSHIEFSLFHLNKTPEFDVIESLSHFYALTCRYFRLKTRLRLFLLDAMYCLQFKVVPLIKQCLDVWMHILPLAHMGIAKSPLVTCLVYLLHFYKCEDRFNRIQDIRMILNKKYFYKMTDWNEPKILDMFRNCLMELREIPLEKKMLRLAFIILAKRQGPIWCQKNIIKNMLIPLIEKENVPLKTKKFCVSLLGPLLKPYPKGMKVHCEIAVNQLLDKLEKNPRDDMKESIFTSLIYMNKHNQNRVTTALLSWSPKQPSEEFEQLMCDFVREKPFRVWKGILSKITL